MLNELLLLSAQCCLSLLNFITFTKPGMLNTETDIYATHESKICKFAYEQKKVIAWSVVC